MIGQSIGLAYHHLSETLGNAGIFYDMMGTMIFKRYADDYETIITTDETGREIKQSVYRGKYYEVGLDQQGITRFNKISLLFLLAIIIVHVAGGFVDNQGMYKFYVALPYVFAFFPLLYMGAGVLRLPKEKRKYRRDEVGLTYERIKTSITTMIIFLAISLLGEFFYIIFVASPDQLTRELLYSASVLFSIGFLFSYLRLLSKINIRVDTED